MAVPTATKSKASLDSAQRAWVEKMGTALDAPASKAALAGDKQAFIGGLGDIIDIIPDARTSNITIKNNSNKPLQLVLGSAKVETRPADFVKAPELDIAPNGGSTTFAVSNELVAGKPAPVGTGGQVQYDVVGDEQKTRLFMQWECGFLFPSRKTIQKVTPKNDALYTLTGSNTGANDFAFIFTSKGGTGPGPTPAGPDAASSCHVTITNDTKLTLTLGNQGHERGDFMTFPAKTLAPGASTTCVSVETPNAKDPKDEGCKGFLLWQVGSPKVLWRVEWDNPEGSKNIASAAFNPPNSGFFSLNQIGQGEENVPTSFTISGGGEEPPTSTGKLSVTVLDEATNQPLEGATVELLDKSAKSDAAGKTVFTPPPGTHPIRATAEGFEENRGTVVMEPGKDVDHVLFMKKKDEPQPAFTPPPESKQPTLRKGDKSADGWVEYLQKLLNKYLGAGTVPEDGNFDQKTYDAVKKFQASTKPPCLVDGIVGNETWSMLRKGEREKVGVNEQDDEKGAEGRWATEKNDFVTYDPSTDELRMVAFSVGDAPIDKFKATFRITSEDKKVQKTFERVIGAPTGPSPTGSGHMHVVVVPKMSATFGSGEHLVEAYLDQILGGDLWKGTVAVKGAGPSGKTGDIGFTVKDAKTGLPVSGAIVKLGSLTKPTDAGGIALFAKAPAGKHPFAVSHGSYDSATGEAEVLADASTPKEVKLKPKSSPPPSGKTGDVGFSVTDAKTGSPVTGATVEVAGRKARTALGIAKFDKLAPASYPYTVSHPSYETASAGVDVEADTTTSEEVKLKPKTGPPGVTGSVGFTVTDKATGKPVSGATVKVAGRTATTDASGSAGFDDLGPASYPYTVTHPLYETASAGVDVEAGSSTPEAVQLQAKAPDTPTPKKPDDQSDAAPAEHRLVDKKTFTHKVALKDTNYGNEDLGHWLLRMEVGLSGTGQVYPLHVDVVPKLKDPANKIINIFPTIKAKSENLNGARSCDITFNVQVAGPNVSSSSGASFGGEVGWKNKVETLEAGLSAEWTIASSHNSQAGGAWSRRFYISGGDRLGFSQDTTWKEDLTGDMVIDDDDGHDQWGVDTDWELHTYDG